MTHTITNSATQLDTATRYFERAVALRDSIREGGIPMFLTANLLQLAGYFKVPTTFTRTEVLEGGYGFRQIHTKRNVREIVCEILINSGLEL